MQLAKAKKTGLPKLVLPLTQVKNHYKRKDNQMKHMGSTNYLSVFLLGTFLFFGSMQIGNSSNGQGELSEGKTRVLISTSMGDIAIVLYDETPEHRDNFVKLAREGFYEGILFHRVIEGFMIQAGDPMSRDAAPGESLGSGGPGYTLPAEIVEGLFHQKGALAAARQGDQVNPERRSSGSQFYIVQGRAWSEAELNQMEQQRGTAFTEAAREAYTTVGGTPHLDDAYTVFGQVVEGLDVVDRIASVQTGRGDRPAEDVSITGMTVLD